MAKEKLTKEQVSKKINEAATNTELNKLRAEAKKHSIEGEFNEMVKTLGNAIKTITEKGATGKKAAEKTGVKDAGKKIEDITKAAVIKGTQVRDAAAQKMAEAFEKEHGKGSLLPKIIGEASTSTQVSRRDAHITRIEGRKHTESGMHNHDSIAAGESAEHKESGAFSGEYQAPELNSERAVHLDTLLNEEEVTTLGTSNDEEAVVIELDPTDTSKKAVKPEEDGESLKPLNLEEDAQPHAATENGPKNLEEARAAFFATYKEVEKNIGFGFKAARYVFGDDKNEGLPESIEDKNPGIIDKYYAEQSAYRGFLAQEGQRMLTEGKSKADVKKMICDELLEKKKQLDPIVPEKVRTILGKGAEFYTKLPKPARMILSTTIATGIMYGTGHVALAGAAGYGASRILKSVIGGAVGQGLVSLKNKIWNAEKDAVKIQEKINAELEGQVGATLSAKDIAAFEKISQKQLDKEQNARIKHLAADFSIRMLAGFGTRGALNALGVDSWFGGHHVDTHGGDKPKVTDHAKAPTPTETPAPAPKVSPYEFKEIAKVDYSAKGSIDTWIQVKAHIRDAYAGVDPSKIPPAYKHILDSRADSLAKEFGEWKPDEVNESINMLKGSSITFDAKTGEIVSHSLKNINGEVEDHTLASMGADGKAAYSGETHERFFDYNGSPTTHGMVDNGATKPHFNGEDTGATKPKFETGTIPAKLHATAEITQDPQQLLPPVTEQEDVYASGTTDEWSDGKHHSLHWLKHHQHQEDRLAERLAKAEMRDAARLGAPQQNMPFQQPNFGPGADTHPIMNPANPGGAAHGVQYIDHSSSLGPNSGSYFNNPSGQPVQHFFDQYPKLAADQVARIMGNPARFIGNDYLLQAMRSHDPALPLYQVLHDLQGKGFAINPGEHVGEFIKRAHEHNPKFFLKMNSDVRTWLGMNGFLG